MFRPALPILLALSLLGLGLAGCENTSPQTVAEAQQPVESIVINKSPNDDRRYGAIMLPNQLQVVLVSDPTIEVAAVSMDVGVGSYQDPDNQLGLAHYLEHMLFLGTKKYPEPNSFQKFVDQNAGVWNAFTSTDETNFFFQLNAGKLDEALDYFSDYFVEPTFDPQYSDKERNAINSEWSMGRAQDNRIMYALSGLTANPAHPASRFTVGNLQTLSDKPDSTLQDALLAFYQRYYSANNMKLTIVGKQSLDELKALAEKHFAGIPNKNIARPQVNIKGLTEAQTGKSIHYKSLKDLKLVMVEFPVKDNTDEWRLKPNEFINNLITSEEPGTLGEQLRKQGLAESVYGYIAPDAYISDGYLRVIAELTDKGLENRDTVIAAIFGYLELIKKEGVEKRYYRELKAMRAKDFENLPKPKPVQQAIALSRNQFDYPVAHLLDADFIYEDFNKAAIENVLKQLQPEKARIWYVSNHEPAQQSVPFYEGSYSIEDTSKESYAKWNKLAASMNFELPPENPLFSDKKADIVKRVYEKPTLIVDQPGIEAWLMHAKYYREDKGFMELHYNIDFALETPQNTVLAALLDDVFTQQSTTLIDRASRAGLGIAIGLDNEHSQTISISGYSGPQQMLFKTLIDNFANLQISEQDFAQALNRYKLSKLNAKKAPPYEQLFDHNQRLISKAGWTDEELLAAAEKVTRNDLQHYQHEIVGDNLVRAYAFGNYAAEDVAHIVHYAAEQMQSDHLPAQRYFEPNITPQPGKDIVYKESLGQTDNAMLEAWIGTEKSIPQQAGLMLLNGILGNELFTQLRTNEQMGYIVGSAPSGFDEYPMFIVYVQSTNTDLPAIKARLDKFRKDYYQTLQKLEPETLEQLKSSEIARILQKPTDFSSEASEHLSDFNQGKFTFDRKQRYVNALRAVTKDDLLALYKQLILNGKGTYMNVQLKGTHFADKPFAKVQ